MKRPTILVVGFFSERPDVYTYATSFAREFEQLGYAVHRFNTHARYNWLASKIASLHPRLAVIHDSVMNRQLVNAVAQDKPDMVFLLKAETVWCSTLKKIKAMSSARLVNFYPDNPFVFWNYNSNDEVLRSLPLYDCFLIWSHMLVDPLRAAGCKRVEYLPFGFEKQLFPDEITITQADHARYQADVCFVGTWDVEREVWLEALVNRMPQLNVAIWGNLWNERLSAQSPLRSALRGAAIYGTEMIKALRVAKIVLNFIRTQNMTSHNMRTFEALAAKSFLLTERTVEQAEQLLHEGEHLACFGTLDELSKKIDYYLNAEEERRVVCDRGHNYAQRYSLDRLLGTLLEKLF